MRVLLAADGSVHGTAALRTAARILSPEVRNADILCIVPPFHPKRPVFHKRVERHAQRIVGAVSTCLALDGVIAKPLVRTGSPASVLVSLAVRYDLIVISSQSHAGNSAGIGPVANRVLDHANSSVLLARDAPGAAQRILIPVDGSEASMEALDALGAFVDLRGADLTLVHVVETPWIRPVDDQEWIETEDDPDEEPQSGIELEFTLEAEAIIERARQHLPPQANVTTMIFHGLPAEELLEEANSGEYSLIVLTATGVDDLKHRMLGSVSSKVAWNAPCSVLLVRPNSESIG